MQFIVFAMDSFLREHCEMSDRHFIVEPSNMFGEHCETQVLAEINGSCSGHSAAQIVALTV